MADSTLTATADAPRRRTRWDGTTADQRRDAMRVVHEAHSLQARERRIADLIAAAPPLTEEQVTRLMILLNGQVAAS